jgi:hypothetical protein
MPNAISTLSHFVLAHNCAQWRFWQFGMALVKPLRISPLAGDRLVVVGLERLQYLFGLIDEVENESILLARMGAIEP